MPYTTTYTPPAVWTWNQGNGGRFANINRPVAGATHEKALPVGRHPLQLYSLGTPNGVKVTVMLEELLALGHAGAEYDAWLIRIERGRPVRQRLRRRQPELEDPGARRPQRRRRRCASSSRARSCSTWPRSSAPSCPTERRGARRVPVVALLADGQRAVPRRRLRPLLRLRAEQVRVRHRPLRDGGQAPARRARPPPRRERATSPATSTRSPTSPSGPGTARSPRASSTGRASSCRCRSTATSCAGPTRSRSGRRRSAAAWSTAPGASRRASCTSATTRATSSRAPPTSSRRGTTGPDDCHDDHALRLRAPRRARAARASCSPRRASRTRPSRSTCAAASSWATPFGSVNPQCTVPALRTDDGLVLTDNAAITA